MAATGATAVALAPFTRPRIQPDVVDRSPPATGVRFAIHPPSLARRLIHLNLAQVTTESTRATVRSLALLPQTRMRPKIFSEGLARRAGRGRMPCDRELRGRDPESRRILRTALEGLRIHRRAGSDRWWRSRGPSRGRRRGCGPRLTGCQAQSSSMISSESSMTTGIKGSKSSCLPALEGGAMMSCSDEETTISRGEGSGKPWFNAVLAAAGGD